MSCRKYHDTVEGFGECDKAFSPSTSSLIEIRQYRHSPPSLVSGGWTSGRVEKKGMKKPAGASGNNKKETLLLEENK